MKLSNVLSHGNSMTMNECEMGDKCTVDNLNDTETSIYHSFPCGHGHSFPLSAVENTMVRRYVSVLVVSFSTSLSQL